MKNRKTSVLICEDNALMLRGLRFLVQQFEDLEVVGLAQDGSQAIEKARELQPDVILMDLEMPELDGISALRIITAEYPYVRVIVISAKQDEDTIKQIKDSGAHGFYPKPVMNAEELYWTIKKSEEN